MFKKIKLTSGLNTKTETHQKTLYIAESTDTSKVINGCRIYSWDGEAWYEECRRREKAFWEKKWARWEKEQERREKRRKRTE